MDRLFLDANVLFSAAYKPQSSLLQLWQLANAVLLTSRYAADEARDALTLVRPQVLPDLVALMQSVHLVPDPPASAVLPPGIQLPDKDKPILLAAIDAKATHLLTGDLKHFGPYLGQSVGGIRIERPGLYLMGRIQTP